MINATPVQTDERGELSTSLKTTHIYAISSGLEAISFPPIVDSGENFNARSPVLLEAERLVSSLQAPCRIVISGAPTIYFSTSNKTDRSLKIPLTMPEMNSLWSVTGQGSPPELFAPGTGGVTVPEEYFGQPEGLAGVLKFLGQEIVLKGVPDVCVDTAVPGSCEVIDAAALVQPREYTRQLIMSLARASISAARSGKWKGTNGKFAVPFMARGAKALAQMDKSMQMSQGHHFLCDVIPMSCSRKSVPKAAMKKAFAKVFSGTSPQGLEHIYARSTKEIKKFERLLAKMPNSYVTCEK